MISHPYPKSGVVKVDCFDSILGTYRLENKPLVLALYPLGDSGMIPEYAQNMPRKYPE
ncbi:hypothetical protein [uncultured Kiloniella sp.]|uniref:hypothetical protein n=1 Tax=Kiloniella sp. TaxID=1938587 RepID=UPI002622E2DC|nr:hypothetical protein [uncultured Kiloniella sp.]